MSLIILLAVLLFISGGKHGFQIEEARIEDIHKAFNQGKLTSRQLTQHYLNRIKIHNPLLHAIIEVNPDSLTQADRADRERQTGSHPLRGSLHGIPVLLKDMIATRDRLNSTAGSLALLGSVVGRDAGVVRRLRKAGAVIVGKASMSEWAHFRYFLAPNGWSPRGGQPRNPYVLWADPCGSSTGSAIGVAANMVMISLGTETDGSILCPAAVNSVVGIKPTVGLTSRAGVIPLSLRQDTIGFCAIARYNGEGRVLTFTASTEWASVLGEICERWGLDVCRARVKFITPDGHNTVCPIENEVDFQRMCHVFSILKGGVVDMVVETDDVPRQPSENELLSW